MAIEFTRILVPLDLQEPSSPLLDAAVELALRLGAQLTLVHVYDVPAFVYGGIPYATSDLFAPIEEGAQAQLQATLRAVQARLPGARAILRRGAAAQGILALIDEVRPDLVVMGTHGRQGMSHALLGSVAEKIVRLSPVPVLTIRDPLEPSAAAPAR